MQEQLNCYIFIIFSCDYLFFEIYLKIIKLETKKKRKLLCLMDTEYFKKQKRFTLLKVSNRFF